MPTISRWNGARSPECRQVSRTCEERDRGQTAALHAAHHRQYMLEALADTRESAECRVIRPAPFTRRRGRYTPKSRARTAALDTVTALVRRSARIVHDRHVERDHPLRRVLCGPERPDEMPSPNADWRTIIRDTLYGVASAGSDEIAQLRLWLALVVDQTRRGAGAADSTKADAGNRLIETSTGVDPLRGGANMIGAEWPRRRNAGLCEAAKSAQVGRLRRSFSAPAVSVSAARVLTAQEHGSYR